MKLSWENKHQTLYYKLDTSGTNFFPVWIDFTKTGATTPYYLKKGPTIGDKSSVNAFNGELNGKLKIAKKCTEYFCDYWIEANNQDGEREFAELFKLKNHQLELAIVKAYREFGPKNGHKYLLAIHWQRRNASRKRLKGSLSGKRSGYRISSGAYLSY